MAFRTNKMPDLQEKSASGSVASFNTALAMPLTSCNIAVNAWQEGTGDPYPAGGSAQIWDEEWELGYYADGTKSSSTTSICSTNKIKVTANTNVYVVAPIAIYVTFYDTNGDYKSDISGLDEYGRKYVTKNTVLTIPADVGYITFFVNQTTYSNNISINYPATDTAYHPYSNVRMIHGFSEVNATRAGKNLFDEQYPDLGAMKYRWIYVGKGTFTMSSNQPLDTSNLMFFFAGKVSSGASSGNNVKGNIYRTVTSDDGYVTVAYRKISGEPSPVNYHYQLEAGSTATTYEPYVTPTIYTIQLGQEVYGAEVDVVGKKLVLTDNLYTPAKADWRIKDGNNYYTKTYSELVGSGYLTGLCNKFKEREGTVSNREWWVSNNGIICICITDTTYNTVENMYDDVGEISFLVPLRTPIEIPLSDIPTLSTIIGNNSFASDSGSIELTYKDLDIAKRGNFREVFRLPS